MLKMTVFYYLSYFLLSLYILQFAIIPEHQVIPEQVTPVENSVWQCINILNEFEAHFYCGDSIGYHLANDYICLCLLIK